MSLFTELKRRNVFRVAAAYIIVGWLLLQVSDTLVPALQLPEIFNSGVAFILIIGFPIALVLAWAYEITPEGLKKEIDVDRSQSITNRTGRKLDFTIIAVLAVAIVYLAGKLWFGEGPVQPVSSTTTSRSIAVLPFENRSADEEDAGFFAAGVHNELLTLLSKISDLKVISRTSVERLDPRLSIPEIGKLLDVATVLEGQVQRAGNRLRINMQLIATMHGYLTSIVDVSLLALSGEAEAAMETLSAAVDQGWKYDWRWHLANRNLDSIRDEPDFEIIKTRLERETALQLEAIRTLPDMGEFDLRSSRKTISK